MTRMERFLLIATMITAIARSKESLDCSRAISRQVKGVLLKEVYPNLRLLEDQYKWPMNCELNPRNDVFGDQERNKEEINEAQWECLYCRKKFVSEFYLDRHMDNKHQDKLQYRESMNGTNGEVFCLADLGPFFGCKNDPSLKSSEKNKKESVHPDDYPTQSNKVSRKVFQHLEKCTNEKLNKIKDKCRSISKRCFPEGSIQERFEEIVCNRLSCNKGVLQSPLRLEERNKYNVFGILRMLFMVIMILIAIIHVMFAEIPVIAAFKTFLFRKKEDDFFSKYQRLHGKATMTSWLDGLKTFGSLNSFLISRSMKKES